MSKVRVIDRLFAFRSYIIDLETKRIQISLERFLQFKSPMICSEGNDLFGSDLPLRGSRRRWHRLAIRCAQCFPDYSLHNFVDFRVAEVGHWFDYLREREMRQGLIIQDTKHHQSCATRQEILSCSSLLSAAAIICFTFDSVDSSEVSISLNSTKTNGSGSTSEPINPSVHKKMISPDSNFSIPVSSPLATP